MFNHMEHDRYILDESRAINMLTGNIGKESISLGEVYKYILSLDSVYSLLNFYNLVCVLIKDKNNNIEVLIELNEYIISRIKTKGGEDIKIIFQSNNFKFIKYVFISFSLCFIRSFIIVVFQTCLAQIKSKIKSLSISFNILLNIFLLFTLK